MNKKNLFTWQVVVASKHHQWKNTKIASKLETQFNLKPKANLNSNIH